MAMVLINGPDSPSWWVALPLLWVIATVSSTALTVAVGVATALAYLAGTLIGGEPLVEHGNAVILTSAVALSANTRDPQVFNADSAAEARERLGEVAATVRLSERPGTNITPPHDRPDLRSSTPKFAYPGSRRCCANVYAEISNDTVRAGSPIRPG